MNLADLHRLARERAQIEQTNGEWWDGREIADDVLSALVEFIPSIFVSHLLEHKETQQALCSMGLDMFMIGFDAGVEFGQKADLSGIDQS